MPRHSPAAAQPPPCEVASERMSMARISTSQVTEMGATFKGAREFNKQLAWE